MADKFSVTPGPWRMERLAQMSPFHYAIYTEGRQWLATVNGDNNARAFALLPRILELLDDAAHGVRIGSAAEELLREIKA